MKIRTDFVTNSSSSSFIIQTDKEIPDEFKKLFELVTKNNLNKMFYDVYNVYTGYTTEDLKEFAELLDIPYEQINLLNALFDLGPDIMRKYKEIVKNLNERKPVYAGIDIDNNINYSSDGRFSEFMSSVNILYTDDDF